MSVNGDIGISGKHRTVHQYGRGVPAADLPGSTALSLVIDRKPDQPGVTSWQDDADGKLEKKMAEIVARIIVAGETRFRRGLREAEERAEQYYR